MKELKDILYKVSVEAVLGNTSIKVSSLEFDSRKVINNSLFVAIRGYTVDGHDYIQKAIQKGAIAVICNELPKEINESVTYIVVDNSKKALSIISSNYFDNPSSNLKLVGVTGTNGKTTTTTMLYELFTVLGYKCGLISTIKILIAGEEIPTLHTTPDSIIINKNLALMSKAGCEYCFMEVSSHGIHQNRSAGLHFTGGVFTNITHDHLDYHETFENYRDVKKSFFDHLPKTAFALYNKDDKNGSVMVQNTRAKKYSYGLKTDTDFPVKILENSFGGLHLKVGQYEVFSSLVGKFNAYNFATVYAVASLLEQDDIEVLSAMSQIGNVKGRFESFKSNEGINVIVDYAHTPDALENVLKTINDIKTQDQKVITLFGCGGDRDKEKRPMMAGVADKLSDKIIITSDNPRTENPKTIIEDILKGIPHASENMKLIVVEDRKEAIKTACMLANKNDVILIAGKGHETYQEIEGVRYPFDDLKITREILNKLNT